ncbi:MAG: ammonium transporter, partial [Candidatus Brocadiales bacterium]
MLRFCREKGAIEITYSPKALLILVLAVLVITSIAGTAAGQESIAEIRENLNLIWVIAAAAMVFFMQIGFTAFEAGSVQAKNAISVSLKNITICMLCAVFYFLVGFALMFGETKLGLVGINHFLFFGVSDISLGYAFAFFQVVFASTAATIITGAMAERTRLITHIWSTILMVCVVYPVFGHWAWGGSFHHEQAGWLTRIGFIDFAGSTVVHSIGAWFGLAGVLLVGPRIGKYNKDGTVNKMGSHNIPLATIGTLFLWFGWFGFNGGSTLRADASVSITIINTNIAAGAGGVVCLLFGWLRAKRFDAEAILLGILGALVAITAGSNRVEPWGALVIGAVAGCLVLLGYDLLDKILKVDDPVGAITVHGFGGVVGTIAVALLAPADTLMVANHSRLLQVGVQFLGITVAFAWAFGLGLLFFWVGNKIVRIRAQPEEEMKGLNLAEYEDVSAWLNLAQIHRLQDLNILLEKRIEGRTQQLSKAKKYTDSIIQSMREMLVVTDIDWNIRDVNPMAKTLLGYRTEELIGRPVSTLTEKDEEIFKDYKLNELLEAEGVIHDYRVNFITKDRKKIPIAFTGSIMRDDAGRPVGMVGIARDMRETFRLIKELQKINEELGISNERFQTTMRSVRMPIATLGVGRKILTVNPAFEELTGWREDEISGSQYDVLLSLAVGTKGFLAEEPGIWVGKA